MYVHFKSNQIVWHLHIMTEQERRLESAESQIYIYFFIVTKQQLRSLQPIKWKDLRKEFMLQPCRLLLTHHSVRLSFLLSDFRTLRAV